jgi:type II secretory pathway pseudopilin PulG
MKKNKRGFSILEAIIAMSVIIIVSITALSIILSASRAAAKNNEWAEAAAKARNVVELYRYFGGGTSNYAGGEAFDGSINTFYQYFTELRYGDSVAITDMDGDSITVTAFYGDGEKFILTYPR